MRFEARYAASGDVHGANQVSGAGRVDLAWASGIGSGIAFEDAGEHGLKGVPGRWNPSRAVGL